MSDNVPVVPVPMVFKYIKRNEGMTSKLTLTYRPRPASIEDDDVDYKEQLVATRHEDSDAGDIVYTRKEYFAIA